MMCRPRVRAIAIAFACATAVNVVTRDAPAAPPAPAPAVTLPPLPMLPSISRVRVAFAKTGVVVTEEVNLPRGEWQGPSLDFYVAFGAPGTPRAIDAHLVALGGGAIEPSDDEAGEVIATTRAPRRPSTAYALLGRETMAGVVVHLDHAALTRAFRAGNAATLRIRTALEPPEEDASGSHGVLVRLGSARGVPLTLGRIALEGTLPPRIEARLCGPDADAHPLAMTGATKPHPPAEPWIAPVLAVRHASDDLCIHYWTTAA
jgi:hypothetical protein